MVSARFALVFSTVSAPSLYLRAVSFRTLPISVCSPLSGRAIGIRPHVMMVRETMRHGA